MAGGRMPFQSQEGLQSLVAENFMRVIGTHNQGSRYKKNDEYSVLSIFDQ
jgi:hypothetical protein